jgi:hypothetical protein
MTETIVIGTFAAPSSAPLSGLSVEMPALDLVAHWRRCGITADFLAAYMAYDFANRPAATNVLSTVMNEILENAAKFSAEKRDPVRISVTQRGDVVLFEATNSADLPRATALRKRLEEVLDSDPETLFLRHIEGVASAPRGAPGMGLLVLRKDYNAALGAQIAVGADGLCEVTVQVRLQTEEIDQ